MLSDCDEVQPSHPSHQDQIAEYRLKRAKAAARDGSAFADREVVAPDDAGAQIPAAANNAARADARGDGPFAAGPVPRGNDAAAPAASAAEAPAPAVEQEEEAFHGGAPKPLDAQQKRVVELSKSSCNLYICGGAGSGKSFTLTQAVLHGEGINAVMGPHHSSTKAITRKCKEELPQAVFAQQRFMTVNRGAGVHLNEAWDAESILAWYS